MKKILLVFTCLIALNITIIFFNSCKEAGPAPCNTSHQNVYCAELKTISVAPYNSAGDKVDSMRPIAAKSLVLTVDMQATEATCRRKVSNLFITSAFACTPPLPRISFKGAITDVIITSNGDFDAAHPAGTDLADYFAIIDADDLNFYEQKNGGFNVQRSFALKQNPAAAGRHQFTIIYKLSNGADIQAVCSPVNLYL